MDSESTASREKGCWDPKTQLGPFYEKWSVPTPDFVVDEVWRGMVAQLGFSGTVPQDKLAFWDQTLKEVYSGDEGRKKLRMALANLMERDGLLTRLRDVKCPVYWLQVSLLVNVPFNDEADTCDRAPRTLSLVTLCPRSRSRCLHLRPRPRLPLLMVLVTTSTPPAPRRPRRQSSRWSRSTLRYHCLIVYHRRKLCPVSA